MQYHHGSPGGLNRVGLDDLDEQFQWLCLGPNVDAKFLINAHQAAEARMRPRGGLPPRDPAVGGTDDGVAQELGTPQAGRQQRDGQQDTQRGSAPTGVNHGLSCVCGGRKNLQECLLHTVQRKSGTGVLDQRSLSSTGFDADRPSCEEGECRWKGGCSGGTQRHEQPQGNDRE